MKVVDSIRKAFLGENFINITDYDKVVKKLNKYAETSRNQMPVRETGGEILSRYEFSKEEIYNITRNSDIISIVHKSLRGEMFRNGFELVESKNTDSDDLMVYDDVEGTEEDRIRLMKFVNSCNKNNDSLKKVMKKLEDDVNTIDQQFCLFLFDYYFDESNNEFKRVIREVDRANPMYIALIVNSRGEFGYNDGRRVFFDPRNRSQPIYDKETTEDGRPLFPAWYREVAGEHSIYYAPWEIWYNVRYRPESITGFSPVMTLYNKIASLYYQDKYIKDTYENGRPPKGILGFTGVNQDNLQEAWEDMKQRAIENPNLPGVIGLPPLANGSADIKFVDFMKTLDEMQFGDVRDEMRRLVGSLYGVSPVFENDISTSGGLNSVLGDTPIIVRKDKTHIDIFPIACLHTDYDHLRSKYGLSKFEALSKSGDWTPIVHSFRQKNKKKVYDVNTVDGFTQVTEDHSLFMGGEEVKGSDIKIGDKIDISKPQFKVNDVSGISPDFAEFLGFFLGDGTSKKMGRNKNNGELQGVRVVCYQKDRAFLDKYKKVVDSFFGISSNIREAKNTNGEVLHHLDMSHNKVYAWINEYCYSSFIEKNTKDGKTETITHREKKVPIQVLNGSEEVMRSFVQGYWNADGEGFEWKGARCSGVYKSLMAGLKYVFNCLGEETSITWQENGKNPIIKLSVLKGDDRQKGRIENDVKKIKEYDFHGDLYDIETEDHSFVAGVGYLSHHNSEGLQITVTNRAVEDGQADYNELLYRLVNELEIKGWCLKLKPSEEQDEMAKLQRQEQSLRNGEIAVRMGLPAEYDDRKGEVIIKNGTLEKPEQLPNPAGFLDEQDSGEAEAMSGTPNLDV